MLLANFNGEVFAIDHNLTKEDCAAYLHVYQKSNPLRVIYTCEIEER